ncbi:hypothetical protein UlMin_044268, partial [Ulmus minor]
TRIHPSILVMGDKSTARKIMKKAGVPIVPGSFGLLQTTEETVKLAHEIGFPVLIKATFGGGGWVKRLAKEPDEFVKLLQSDAAWAFGKDGVYLEKYVQNPRHIEFLVLADKYGNFVQFGEVDCSIRRGNQKLLEEASSPALSPELRKAMGDAAGAAALSIGYIGVGMVKFLLDERGSFYFMDTNTPSQLMEKTIQEMALWGFSVDPTVANSYVIYYSIYGTCFGFVGELTFCWLTNPGTFVVKKHDFSDVYPSRNTFGEQLEEEHKLLSFVADLRDVRNGSSHDITLFSDILQRSIAVHKKLTNILL